MIGHLAVGDRVRIPARFIEASPVGPEICLDGTGTVASINQPMADGRSWCMVAIGDFGEFGFFDSELARDGRDFSVTLRWEPTGSDRRQLGPTTGAEEMLDEARQYGRAAATWDGVNAVTIHGPTGAEVASWRRGGTWRETEAAK